jgi:hypothetical protein
MMIRSTYRYEASPDDGCLATFSSVTTRGTGGDSSVLGKATSPQGAPSTSERINKYIWAAADQK